jgi:energy-coupling factor transporter ATP-binding protein EcfA2
MSSRAIRLTQIHAINWYGYRDSFAVSGNLLVAGVTGSGKSVLMDLIQLVLIGHQQKVRYNQSATGDRSTRDLKGYCLGDTKQDIDGVPQYMRQGGVTYVALEFTWPGTRTPRMETWGLRIEFESVAQHTPSIRPFVIPAGVTRNDFLDDRRVPLDLVAFRQWVESHAGPAGRTGRLFTGIDEYRRELALPSHLNFDRPTLDYLLPAAMSFTFMDSFNDFCRRYILPAEAVDIRGVRDSYLAFREAQRMLSTLRDQGERLEKIHGIDAKRSEAERDRLAGRYAEALLRAEAAEEALAAEQRLQATLEAELAGETARIVELEREIEQGDQRRGEVEATLNASEDGKFFRRLQQENQELTARIRRLKDIGESVEQARQLRVKNARWFAGLLAKLPVDAPAGPWSAVQRAAEALESASPTELKERTRALAGACTVARQAAQALVKPVEEEFRRLEREDHQLKASLLALRSGALTENSVLLSALNARLPRRGNELPAQAMWQLCEVTDEVWRPALEVTFGRKFAVVVSERDYDAAESIYHELREESKGESLVNPKQALELGRAPRPGSLALKLETKHPVARALVDHLFGDVICVDDLRELRKHEKAILPDGFQVRRPFVQRPRHYDNLPCIGKKGLERRRAWLQEQQDALKARQRQLEPLLTLWREATEFHDQSGLHRESLHDDLAEAAGLPELQKKLENNLADLRSIRTADLEAREAELREWRERLATWRRERDGLLQSGNRQRMGQIADNLRRLQEALESAQDQVKTVRDAEDVSPHLARIEELRERFRAEFPVRTVAADRLQTLWREAEVTARVARTELVAERRDLARVHDPQFSDLDPEATENATYEARRARIAQAHIPEYEQKAVTEERNWQQLFREQVLEKLRERLLMVENLMTLLRTALDKPIGNNRYRIVARQNRDGEFDLYRRLLDLSATVRGDEMLFATADGEIREAVERIFRAITAETGTGGAEAERFLDYRNYHDYDIEVANVNDPDARAYSVNRAAGKSSGGENQTPYFVAILASYLRAYRRHETRRKEPALALVPIDEAFSKLSGDRIRDCIRALHTLDLQGVFSMSTGNIPYAVDQCDQVIAIHKQEKTAGRRTEIRNVAVSLTRAEALEKFGG